MIGATMCAYATHVRGTRPSFELGGQLLISPSCPHMWVGPWTRARGQRACPLISSRSSNPIGHSKNGHPPYPQMKRSGVIVPINSSSGPDGHLNGPGTLTSPDGTGQCIDQNLIQMMMHKSSKPRIIGEKIAKLIGTSERHSGRVRPKEPVGSPGET